jgi:ParB/RepB/Spo0J family partition protein
MNMLTKLKDIVVKSNVRQDLGDLSDLESIKEHGVLQPLVCRKVGKELVLLAGHRRRAAALKYGLTEVPVHIVDVKEDDVEALQLIENLGRKDLTPLEVCDTIGKELTRRGFRLDHEQAIPAGLDEVAEDIARKTGTKISWVKQMARLVFLPKWAADMFKKDNLTVEQALMILQLPPAQQERLHKNYYRFNGLSKPGDKVVTSDLEAFIDRLFGKDLTKAPFPLDEPVGKQLPCLLCSYNTSNTEELFPGAGGGICRKAECYRGKCQSVSTELKEQTLQKNPGLVFVGYTSVRDGLYTGEGSVREVRGNPVITLDATAKKAIGERNSFYLNPEKHQGKETPKAKIGFGIVRAKEGKQARVVYVRVKGAEGVGKEKAGNTGEIRNRSNDVAREVLTALHEKLILAPAIELIKKKKIKPEDALIMDNDQDALRKLIGQAKPTWEDVAKALLLAAFEDDVCGLQKHVGLDVEKIQKEVIAKVLTKSEEIAEAWTPKDYYYHNTPDWLVKALADFVEGKPLDLKAAAAAAPQPAAAGDDEDEDE